MALSDDLTTLLDDLKTLTTAVETMQADVAASATEDPIFTAVKKAFTDAGWTAPETETPAEDATETTEESVAATAAAA